MALATVMKNRERETFIRQKLALLFPPPKKPVSDELLHYGRRLTLGERVTPGEAGRAMEIMIGGRSAPYETALFLTSFRAESCNPEVLAAMACVMRSRATRVRLRAHVKLLADSCGTGGDNLHLFNVSTVTMFMLAAAGLPIAKHGNRASTSRCGSADVLDELGVRVDLGPEDVARCIERVGIGFMFAPRYHPAMKNVAAVRKSLPFRTVFNLLGPLSNPAPVTYQLLGVYDPSILELIARTLALLKLKSAFVVCGSAGKEDIWMDEVSTLGTTHAVYIEGAEFRRIEIEPRTMGIVPPSLDELRGGSPRDNALILRGILDNSDMSPRRDICLANAAVGLYGAGMVESLRDGTARARETLESEAALRKLELLIKESNKSALYSPDGLSLPAGRQAAKSRLAGRSQASESF